MCFKIPCKKYLRPLSVSLLFVFLFASTLVVAGDRPGVDRALFWSVQKNGETVANVLGTIHSEDPRVLDFSADFISRLRANQVFAMELVPDQSTLLRLNEYMHYPPEQTLQSEIGPELYNALLAALAGRKISAASINRMKPWAAMMTLSTPPPETGFFMDLSLSLRAQGSGLEVVGLETLEQQLSFLQDMPMPMQLALLKQAIAESAEVDEAHQQMVNAYLKNDLGELQALSNEQIKGAGREAAEYFIAEGIHARNRRMLASLLPYLESKRVFVAVGALHLPGEQGLLNLLRQQGYELQPLALPFAETPPPPGGH